MREEAVSEQTNNFLCIHRLRSRFPLLAAYNLLLSTLISIIVPMALESSCPRSKDKDKEQRGTERSEELTALFFLFFSLRRYISTSCACTTSDPETIVKVARAFERRYI